MGKHFKDSDMGQCHAAVKYLPETVERRFKKFFYFNATNALLLFTYIITVHLTYFSKDGFR